jgi:hypothetical protein
MKKEYHRNIINERQAEDEEERESIRYRHELNAKYSESIDTEAMLAGLKDLRKKAKKQGLSKEQEIEKKILEANLFKVDLMDFCIDKDRYQILKKDKK